MNLAQLYSGQEAVIKAFSDDILSLKFMEMGCIPGTKIKVLRTAPFGGPVMLKLWNYTLCLRKDEAAKIEIE